MTKIHNLKGAIQYALNTEDGKRALTKTPFRNKRTEKVIWRNSSIAQALKLAAYDSHKRQRLIDKMNIATGLEKATMFFKKPKGKQGALHPKKLYSWLTKRK